ncbi:hypothetical protein [Streptomyces sp. NBC_00648]|uniref:hypothetical protein n=1 Tax=Streptomyces sp. NBC_00648 TaxID=2975797 RepID=UPI00324A99B1
MTWWTRRRPDPRTAAAAALPIPHPFDLETFCAGIAEQRGRPLHLLALQGARDPGLPCGLWLGLDSADLVFYDDQAADILKVHIVLHEISHMLLGHTAPDLGPPVAHTADAAEQRTLHGHLERALRHAARTGSTGTAAPLPTAEIIRAEADRIRALATVRRPADDAIGLDPARIAQLLGRTQYAGEQERDAEHLATLILERASRDETRPTTPRAAEALIRFNDLYGHPDRP